MKVKVIFIENFFRNLKTKTKCHFQAPPISNLPFGNIFFQFKAYTSVEIDAIDIEMAQQIKLSGCLTNDNFFCKKWLKMHF